MKNSTSFLDRAIDWFDAIGRARVWSTLRAMDREQLRRAGISPELLDEGPNAWPWGTESYENGGANDHPVDPARVDERGKPVPIDSIDELMQTGASDLPDPAGSGHRNEAA